MKIDINKKYRYRDGTPARILCVDAKLEGRPVISMREDTSGIFRHTPDGKQFLSGTESNVDLIEVREPWEGTLKLVGRELKVWNGTSWREDWPEGMTFRVREIID